MCLSELNDQVTCDQNEDAVVSEKKHTAPNFDYHAMARMESTQNQEFWVVGARGKDSEVDVELGPHSEALVSWVVYETCSH